MILSKDDNDRLERILEMTKRRNFAIHYENVDGLTIWKLADLDAKVVIKPDVDVFWTLEGIEDYLSILDARDDLIACTATRAVSFQNEEQISFEEGLRLDDASDDTPF